MTTSETAAASASFSVGQGTSGERADILETLRTHRYFLRHTADGLTDEQARLSPTASELTVGGLIKHVSAIEAGWADFAERGTEAMPSIEGEISPEVLEKFQNEFRLLPDESLDLDTAYPLPPAPWFAPGATRTVRRVFLHIVAETAQHSGHADIIRETIDGQKTMG